MVVLDGEARGLCLRVRFEGCALEIVIIPLFSSTRLSIVDKKVRLYSLTMNMELQNFKY